MDSEFERFFKSQPELCDFIVELTQDSEQRIQELSLFLSYMVFKAVENGQQNALPVVTHESIESAMHQSETWIEKINEAEGSETKSSLLSSLADDGEPYLLQYVLSEINQPLDEGAPLTDEEKGEVFFVLKTVIATLSRNPFDTKSAEEK